MGTQMQLSRSVAGRVAVITGAASGIGRATAVLLVDEGARVVAVDRAAGGLDGLVGELGEASSRVRTVVVDLAEGTAASTIVTAAHESFGPIDIVVNAAGVSAPVTLDGDNFEDLWRLAFAVNVDAQVLLLRASLTDLCRNADGRVVNIASTEGLSATAPMAPYTASKHAVIGLTRSLAVELGPRGVNVNCICPGPINTGMTEPIPEEAKAIYARRRTALRRYGEPEEVAHMILSLVMPAASFVTGAVLTVDGGLSVRSN
jgi:3-oxoacyl-[acyl-carrier protein] reductase